MRKEQNRKRRISAIAVAIVRLAGLTAMYTLLSREFCP